jgi:Protein of unknown function (DUF2865)
MPSRNPSDHRSRTAAGGDGAPRGRLLGRICGDGLRSAAVCGLAALAALSVAGSGAAANNGGGFFSFLEGLLGLPPPGQPRRPRRPERSPTPPAVAAPVPAPPEPPAAVATYRTMCVRLCDGYYWPVSFATVKEHFGHDAETCAKSCRATVALYHYPNPGGKLEDMVSLEGRPYKSLGTAFLYRAAYDPSCKCRAHPWEEAAIERHKGYAKSRETRAAASGRRGR